MNEEKPGTGQTGGQTFWFPLVTLLLPPSTSDTPSLGSIAEDSLPLTFSSLLASWLRRTLERASPSAVSLVHFGILIGITAMGIITRAR